jgi:hypothetical protein
MGEGLVAGSTSSKRDILVYDDAKIDIYALLSSNIAPPKYFSANYNHGNYIYCTAKAAKRLVMSTYRNLQIADTQYRSAFQEIRSC